jgi:hypothetical protein
MQFNFIGSLPLNSVVNQLQAGAARRGKSPLRGKEPGALPGGERLRADNSIFSEQRVPQTLIATFRCAAVQATSASLSLQSVATPAINIRRTRGERYVQFRIGELKADHNSPVDNIVKSPMFESARFANGYDFPATDQIATPAVYCP